MGSITGSRRSPGRGHWQLTPVFLPGESHGQRSLVGYSPGGHKESDPTEATYHAHSQAYNSPARFRLEDVRTSVREA